MTVSRQGWAYEIVSGGERVDGFVLYDVRFWTSLKRQQDGLGAHVIAGVRCDLANNFKMQIRTNHQRIKKLPGTVQEPGGFMVHASGLSVPTQLVVDTVELKAFLKANGDPTRSGYPPFIFPTYAGAGEELSDEWKHETYTLPLLGQAEANIERYIDVVIRESWGGDRRGTTINLQVGAGADDAHEHADNTLFSSTLTFMSAFSDSSAAVRYNAGARFTSVTVPNAATINAADIQTLTGFLSVDDANVDIHAEDVDNAANFTSTADVTDRVPTTASVQWTQDALGTSFVTSPDIKVPVQELVDRGSWASGNAAVILLRGKSDISKSWQILTFENDSADGIKLDITYEAVGAATQRYTLTTLGVG